MQSTVTLDQLVDVTKAYLIQNNYADSTISSYRYVWNGLSRFYGKGLKFTAPVVPGPSTIIRKPSSRMVFKLVLIILHLRQPYKWIFTLKVTYIIPIGTIRLFLSNALNCSTGIEQPLYQPATEPYQSH